MKTITLQIYLILAILWGLVSCAPKAIIVDPITPHVVKARADVHAAAVGAKRVQTDVVVVHAQSKGIAATANNLVAETDRLRKLPGVPLAEFDALWTMANNLQRETFAHELQARETVVAAEEAEKLNVAAENSTAALEPLSKKQDAVVVAQNTKLEKQQDDVNFAKAVRAWIWMAVAAVVIVGGLFLYAKINPGFP